MIFETEGGKYNMKQLETIIDSIEKDKLLEFNIKLY